MLKDVYKIEQAVRNALPACLHICSDHHIAERIYQDEKVNWLSEKAKNYSIFRDDKFTLSLYLYVNDSYTNYVKFHL